MNGKIPSFLLSPCDPFVPAGHRTLSPSVVDRSVRQIASLMRTTFMQWELSSRKGLLQKTDARVKLLGLLLLLIVASLKKAVFPELCLAGCLFALVLLSRLTLPGFYRHICLLTFLFGFLIVAPAALNIFTDGAIVLPLLRLQKSYRFWVYHLPPAIGITTEGLAVVSLMTVRVFNSLSICFLLLYTTPLTELIRALKVLRVPDTILMIFVLTYKYILIFSRTLEEIYLARKSRLPCACARTRTGEWAAGRMAFFFRKTQLRCEEVFTAMVSRGATRTFNLQKAPPVTARDLFIGSCLLVTALVLLWI